MASIQYLILASAIVMLMLAHEGENHYNQVTISSQFLKNEKKKIDISKSAI